MKKSGIELIAIERQEQIEKHGWNIAVDVDYTNEENEVGPMSSWVNDDAWGETPNWGIEDIEWSDEEYDDINNFFDGKEI